MHVSEELLTQCLSCSQGIHATSWDTEEKLCQLTWHHDAQLLGIPMRHEEEERQEQCICRQASQLAWGASPSLSDINPISDPRSI